MLIKGRHTEGRPGKAPTGLNFSPSILLELAKRCKIIYFVQFLA